jgi:hypothetical protein
MKRPTLLRTIGVSVLGENTMLHMMMMAMRSMPMILESEMAAIFRARFIF